MTAASSEEHSTVASTDPKDEWENYRPPPAGPILCILALQRIKRFKQLVMHRHRYAGDKPVPLGKLIRNPPDHPMEQNDAIEAALRELVPTLTRDCFRAFVDMRVEWYDQEVDLIQGVDRLPDGTGQLRRELFRRLDVAAGFYKSARWNPINWVAAALHIPITIMERAGIEGFGAWYAKTIQALLLLVLSWLALKLLDDVEAIAKLVSLLRKLIG